MSNISLIAERSHMYRIDPERCNADALMWAVETVLSIVRSDPDLSRYDLYFQIEPPYGDLDPPNTVMNISLIVEVEVEPNSGIIVPITLAVIKVLRGEPWRLYTYGYNITAGIDERVHRLLVDVLKAELVE